MFGEISGVRIHQSKSKKGRNKNPLDKPSLTLYNTIHTLLTAMTERKAQKICPQRVGGRCKPMEVLRDTGS